MKTDSVVYEAGAYEAGAYEDAHPLELFRALPPAKGGKYYKISGEEKKELTCWDLVNEAISLSEENAENISEENKEMMYTVARSESHVGAVAYCTGAYSVSKVSGVEAVAANTGYFGAAIAAGAESVAASIGMRSVVFAGEKSIAAAIGDGSLASCENHSVAVATGDNAKATANSDSIAVVTGYYSMAEAVEQHSVAVVTGRGGKAKGAIGCALFLARKNAYGKILHVKAVIVGQDGVEPDTYYSLDLAGNLVKVS